MKSFVLPVISMLAIAGFGLNASRVSPITNPPIRQAGLDAHDGSASASLLGQFRTNVSAWLWVHTDLYLHNGVHMRPMTDSEVRAGVQVASAAKDGSENLDHGMIVTLVPPPDRDFRGVLGDVDRAVNAWKDMKNHKHNDPKQTLPLFRLMTWLDPQFIEAWTTGATVMARDRNPLATGHAKAFLKEGLISNPGNMDLLSELAYIQITREEDLADSIPLLERARQRGYAMRAALSETEQGTLDNTYRWLSLCYRDTGQPQRVVQTAKEGLTLFKVDTILASLAAHPVAVKNQPKIVVSGGDGDE